MDTTKATTTESRECDTDTSMIVTVNHTNIRKVMPRVTERVSERPGKKMMLLERSEYEN